VLIAAGCNTTVNEEVGLIGCADALPALAAPSASLLDDSISVRDFDRRQWSAQTVRVPLRQVEHNPALLRSGALLCGCCGEAAGSEREQDVRMALDLQQDPATVAAGAALEVLTIAGSWMAATIDTAADDAGCPRRAGGLLGLDRSPRAGESFQRVPVPEPDYALRWIIHNAPTTGEAADAD
jgi:hypothetical protein